MLVCGPIQTHPENVVVDQVALKFHASVRLVVASGATRAGCSSTEIQLSQHLEILIPQRVAVRT